MPAKGKDKKTKQEVIRDGTDFTRRPLPAVEPCNAKPAPRAERRIISAHHVFEQWDDEAIAAEHWGNAGESFNDDEGRSFLPSRLSALVAGWVRPKELLQNAEGSALDTEGAGRSVSKGTQGKAPVAEKGKAKSKGKDKTQSVAPVLLEDASVDQEGKPLPRVFVPPTKTPGNFAAGRHGALDQNNGVADGNYTSVAKKSLPRGFKPGWDEEQLQGIAALSAGNPQDHSQRQSTPEDAEATTATEVPPKRAGEEPSGVVGSTPPVPVGFLAEDAVVTLGAPVGGDIDPAMTAIFKAVAQLSPTFAIAGCPLLWEAIYPQTADEVPCYNPCGRYLVRLFAAGRWRRVEVDDSIPIDAARSPVLAASEHPLELWPLLLSKALYKLYRLGGYGLAQGATLVAERGVSGGGVVGEVDQAQFVAFALHSLTGWIPSVANGTPSMEEALVGGTPGLTPDDLLLPALPPVDEEEEAARERLEERKRRQALFLHKKRRPRKVERKVVTEEERAEVDSARLRKIQAVSAKLQEGERHEVYVVCMPGEPACPILAVCPPAPVPNPTTNNVGHTNNESLTQPASVGTSNAARSEGTADSNNNQLPPSPRPKTATAVATQEEPPVGFLLRWEAPGKSQSKPATDAFFAGNGEPPAEGVEGALVGGEGGALDVDAKEGARGARALYGSGSRWRGHGEESMVETANTTPPLLATPVSRWVAPREIERAGGIVVRALTKLDKRFYADIPYHWRIAPSKPRESDAAIADEVVTPKDGHPLASAVPGTAAEGLSGTVVRDPGCPPAIFIRVVPSPRLEPAQGVPPANEVDAPEEDSQTRSGSIRGNHENEIIPANTSPAIPDAAAPESETRASKPDLRQSGGAERLAHGVGEEEETPTGPGEENADPASAVGENAGGLLSGENGGEQNCEGNRSDGKEEEEEEEEAEIVTCIWADQPGGGGETTAGDGRALAVLQEVLPGGPSAVSASSPKPIPGGRVLLRTRLDPKLNGLPLTASSAKIHLVRGGPPRVFRVLLQPGLGCCVGFSCTHEIETGDAGQVWADAGYSQITDTGKYDGAGAGEWRILFKRAFRVTDQSEELEESVDQSAAGVVIDSGDSASLETLPTARRTSQEENDESETSHTAGKHLQGSSLPTFVKAILHITDEAARPSVRLAFVDEDNGSDIIQPSLHTNTIPLLPNQKGYTVVAAACSRSAPMPKGAWRLQLLSDRPLLPLEDPGSERLGGGEPPDGGVHDEGATTIVACQERTVYGGVYVPNKYLLIFRDVLTCASPLPFALRLRCSMPGIYVRLTFLDATTGEILRDLRGRNMLQALSITPPPPSEEPSFSPPPKEAGKGSKDKGGGAEPVVCPPGKLLVEAVVDWESMQVPPHLESELPYYFQPTPEGLPHYRPPRPNVDRSSESNRSSYTSGTQPQGQNRGAGAGGGGAPSQKHTYSTGATEPSTAAAGAGAVEVVKGPETAEGVTPNMEQLERETEPLRWWLEIVGAGEVTMAHDTARVDKENAEVERWEAADPGRATRAALLWTQREASKVANSGNEFPALAATTTPAAQGVQGDEDWIKARAAAVGVPATLEAERQASRAALQAQGVPLLPAPSSGSSFSVVGPSSPADKPATVVLSPEELLERKEERAALRVRTEEFEKEWEADRVKKIEAGKEEMAMQLEFIRGREETLQAALLPFLHAREQIIQSMIAKEEARKEALAADREALESASKAKSKQAKGKSGKK